MSNLNFVLKIQKVITSISVISISFTQKMQKYEICFEIKYFDEEFNLSKSDQSCDYDSDSTDDEESDQKSSNNAVKSTHLVLLAVLQQSDSLTYSEAIQNAQNAHIDDEISSFSNKVFATKEQLAGLHMKDLVKSASYREVMNSQQHDH